MPSERQSQLGTLGVFCCFPSPPPMHVFPGPSESLDLGSGATRRLAWSRPHCLLSGVPWGFPASQGMGKVFLHLSTGFQSSIWFLRGDLKSTFAKNIVGESALDVNGGKRPLVKTALRPPVRPAIFASMAECTLSASSLPGRWRVLGRLEAICAFRELTVWPPPVLCMCRGLST